jgi:hypothetical protein
MQIHICRFAFIAVYSRFQGMSGITWRIECCHFEQPVLILSWRTHSLEITVPDVGNLATPQRGKPTTNKTLRNPQNFSYEVSHLRGQATTACDEFRNGTGQIRRSRMDADILFDGSVEHEDKGEPDESGCKLALFLSC